MLGANWSLTDPCVGPMRVSCGPYSLFEKAAGDPVELP